MNNCHSAVRKGIALSFVKKAENFREYSLKIAVNRHYSLSTIAYFAKKHYLCSVNP